MSLRFKSFLAPVFIIELACTVVSNGQAERFDFTSFFPGPYPGGIAVTKDGTAFIGVNGVIRQLSRAGTNWVSMVICGTEGVFGNIDGTNSGARLDTPFSLALAQDGTLFITGDDTIRQLKQYGTNWVLTTICGVAGVQGSADGTNSGIRFSTPQGVALDNSGGLYVADFLNYTIRRLVHIGTNWVSSTIAGLAKSSGMQDRTNSASRFWGPRRLAVDLAGNVFVTDWIDEPNSGGVSYIRVVSPCGTDWVTSTLEYDLTNVDVAEEVIGIAFGPQGQLYEASESCTIAEIAPLGSNLVQTVLAGALHAPGYADGTNFAARFYFPHEIAVDGMGNLYVVDGSFNLRFGLRLPPPPPVMNSFTRGADFFNSSWFATLGSRYQLQRSSDLRNWMSLCPGITATNQLISFTDPLPPPGLGFYRLTLLP